MEVCALLPQRLRNHFTFSTYFGNSSASVDCFLRMLPDFSPLVSNIRRFHTADTIELGKPNELPTMEHYPAIYEYACTGNIPQSDLYNTEITEPEPPSMHTLEETLYLTDNASPESTDIPAIEIPPPVSCNKNYSKFVFAAAAAILVIGITILLLYDIPGKMAVPSKEKRNTNNRRKILQQPGNIAPFVPITPSVKSAKVPAVTPSASKSSW